MNPSISVIVPIYCEEETLPELYRRLASVLDEIGRTAEMIFVDDASTDTSMTLMREFHRKDPRVKIVSLARNFGHQTAITAGLHHSSGDSIILMDGDLQDPPEVLPRLLQTQEQGGWDIVYGVRRKRKEPALIRFLYYIFYRMLKSFSYIDIPPDAGDFCVMTRRVVDQLNAMPERNRFVRGLRSWVGFRQTGMEYERAAREAGVAKYSFRALFKLAFDGIFSFSYLPLRLSTYLGVGLSGLGLLYAVYLVTKTLAGTFQGLQGWPTVIVSVLVLGGVQLIMLGLMGEYLGRIFEEIKGRPQYVVDETIGFDDGAGAGESDAAKTSPRSASVRPPAGV